MTRLEISARYPILKQLDRSKKPALDLALTDTFWRQAKVLEFTLPPLSSIIGGTTVTITKEIGEPMEFPWDMTSLLNKLLGDTKSGKDAAPSVFYEFRIITRIALLPEDIDSRLLFNRKSIGTLIPQPVDWSVALMPSIDSSSLSADSIVSLEINKPEKYYAALRFLERRLRTYQLALAQLDNTNVAIREIAKSTYERRAPLLESLYVNRQYALGLMDVWQ